MSQQQWRLRRQIWCDSMVKTFQVYLGVNGGGTNRCSSSSTSSSGGTDSPDAIVVDERTYSCIHCRAHLARHEDLISKSFQGTQGRAYLFEAVVNVSCGKTEERLLLTGELIFTCSCREGSDLINVAITISARLPPWPRFSTSCRSMSRNEDWPSACEAKLHALH
ncbi:protein yippee 1 [Echinococcus multilocularis]|uniref:Protein yippee 1 n=1 Tax=Echinococcus multilocularis TaxID=6211 RepID=A0A087VZG5_ECHMU|nr:protein yippee 1 [Echinococcus multilocularis]